MNIRLNNVRYAHSGSHDRQPRVVFRDLSLQFGHGECTGIVGPEGSGKSTLLGLISGILLPEAGTVDREGMHLRGKSHHPPAIPGMIGVSMQFPDEQFSRVTIAEEFPAESRGRMEEALRAAGLDPAVYCQRSPFSLSLGEARMLALALLLAQDPDVAILDAPTAGLDSSGYVRTIRAMERFKKRGKTLVVASHDVGFLRECADRVIGLHSGEVVAEGEADRILSDARTLARLGYDGGISGDIAQQALARRR